ncbi:hypothetical protein K431DRAFT_104778 [Polychaeton citri CBS 116435]|uniref:Uncharacterized protein n=1 Tax=Polychaeton citri CBS 116435 TaxID=1314669 RepID=A0A9P4Q3C4_9PEZI|nr:hypothetical protein K431DRAFT_104778 [Polychaeton citri CBS 116435]
MGHPPTNPHLHRGTIWKRINRTIPTHCPRILGQQHRSHAPQAKLSTACNPVFTAFVLVAKDWRRKKGEEIRPMHAEVADQKLLSVRLSLLCSLLDHFNGWDRTTDILWFFVSSPHQPGLRNHKAKMRSEIRWDGTGPHRHHCRCLLGRFLLSIFSFFASVAVSADVERCRNCYERNFLTSMSILFFLRFPSVHRIVSYLN